MNDFKMDSREKIVAMVKAAGQEVIDRADDLVGNGDFITDFNIWLRFNADGLFWAPTIEVSREHRVENFYKVAIK